MFRSLLTIVRYAWMKMINILHRKSLQHERNIILHEYLLIAQPLHNRLIDHLQDVTTNNYNTVAISTLHSSLLPTLVSSVYYSLH
jgi:hypothetical protein